MKQYVVDAFTDHVFAGNPAAVCVMNGTRFPGTPLGSSPINAEGWAPIGLK